MEFRKVVRAVLGDKKLSIAHKLYKLKQSLDSGDYRHALNHPIFNNFLFKEPYFTTISEIKIKEPFLFTADFKKEFRWLAYIVEYHFSDIEEFMQMKLEFESSVLREQYADSKQVLKAIEKRFGVSLWTLEANLMLADLTINTEANWNLLSNYLNQINHSIYNFNISASSKRFEASFSYDSYLNQFQNDIDSIHATGLIKDYLVFKDFNFANYDYEFKELSSVLYVANIFSVIDQYLTLIDVIVYHISNASEHDKLFVNFIKNGKEQIPSDVRVTNLYNLINQKDEFVVMRGSDSILHCWDLYYSGEFEQSHSEAKALIVTNPLEYDLYLIYCKSLISLKQEFVTLKLGHIADQLLLDTYKLLCSKKDDEDCMKRLLKASLLLANFNIGKQIFAFLQNVEAVYSWHNSAAILLSTYNSPRNVLFRRKEMRVKPNLTVMDFRPSFQAEYLKENITGGSDRRPSSSTAQEAFVQASHKFKDDKFEEVIDLLSHLDITNNPYYLEKRNTLLYYSFIHLDRLKEALILLNSIYFDNELVYRKIDYAILYNKIKISPNKEQFNNLIDYPILYSFVVKEYDLYEVYDDFMVSINANSIEDLEVDALLQQFGKSKLIYFLNKVITVDTLKYNTDYVSISDVEEVRIYVLKILVSLDPGNKSLYEKERDEIYRASSVRKVLKEVDEGRLYIDVNNLKALQIKKFNDDFKRYKEIELSSATQPLIGFNPFNTKDWDKAISEKNESTYYFNSADYLAFKSIYLESRDNFLFSKEYGLDSCLSTRIRHGALKNHLRSVFEKLDLVTSRSKDHYIDNTVWQHQLENYPELNAKVQARLKAFSRQVDDYTTYIRDSLVQISTEKQPDKKDGLFAYFTNDELLFNFYSEHKHLFASIDKTIEIILGQLVNYTLIYVQEKIENTFKTIIASYFKDTIETTISDLRKMDLPSECQLISNLTKSSTDIHLELDYLSEWFYINTTSSSSILSIQTLLDASLNLTNRINPLFNLVPNVTFRKEFAGYSNLIFVFNILLKNVIVHSNLEPTDIVLGVESDVTEDERYAFITFTNNVKPGLDYSANVNKLKLVKENWNDHDQIERSNTEGESGYDKIKRILLYETLAKTDRFEFDFNDSKFAITLFFPYNKPLIDAQDTDN